MTYTAASGHQMNVVSTRAKDGIEFPDYWNASHSNLCPCLTSEDW